VHDGTNWTPGPELVKTPDSKLADEHTSAQRFELVRRLADDLAHELKNPLNAMVINLEVLRARVRAGNTEAALDRVDVLEQETRRLHHLLDSVLRLLRPEPAGVGEFPVDVVLAEVGTIAAVLGKLSRRTFEVQPSGEETLVSGRRESLRFALLALTEAALAGAPEEGEVSLTAALAPAAVELNLATPAAARARLEAALPMAACLLAPDGVPLGVSLDETGCRVRIVLPRVKA
jgi:signal transduction histidine kinase